MSIRNSRNAVAHVFRIVIRVIFGIVAAVFFALLFGIVVMHLWNWLMPEIFGLGSIGFWQAFGLVVLARLLVGGGHHDTHWNHGDDHWHKKLPPFFPVPDEARQRRREYRDFWHREGRAAFEEYLRRRNGAGTDGESPESGK
ncbi:MAG: hypothetical protein AB2L13_04405 [Spirochaetota bacterium]|jgi:hypothetical protein